MGNEIALLDQGHPFRRRARATGEQRRPWLMAVALLFACACGDSENDAGAPPLPNAPPDAGSAEPSAPPAPSDAAPPDAGAPEPSPSDDEPAPDDDSSGSSSGSGSDGVDLNELACASGETTICIDDDVVVLCQGGQPIETSCAAVCGTFGLNPGPCDDGCQCGEASSPSCELASEDFCACSALVGSGECTPEMRDRLYTGCFINGIAGELMACTAEFRSTRPDAAVDEAFCTELNDTCN